VWTLKLIDDAVLRSAYIYPFELILRRYLALDEFSDLAVDLAQFLGNLAAQILVDLNNLLLDFGSFAAQSAFTSEYVCAPSVFLRRKRSKDRAAAGSGLSARVRLAILSQILQVAPRLAQDPSQP
jgi:hypothetical protein